MIISAIGQDSHRFEEENKPLILGGVLLKNEKGLKGNSDADVILHAVTNAVSGVTGRNILGAVADEMCRKGLTDSRAYLEEALKDLAAMGGKICHVSLSMETKRPYMAPHIPLIRESLADILGIRPEQVGFTATSGEGLTAFGRGEGIQVFCLLTVSLPGEES